MSEQNLNAPKYWSAHIASWLLKSMASWPDGLRYRLGKGMAFLATRFAKSRMHIARTNLRLCFPDWSDEQVEQVSQQQMHYFAQALMDRSLFWFGRKEALFSHIQPRDEHHLHAALAQKRPSDYHSRTTFCRIGCRRCALQCRISDGEHVSASIQSGV